MFVRPPVVIPTVEYLNGIVSQTSQQPPKSRGKSALVLIIRNHLCAPLHPHLAEFATEHLLARQWVSPGLIGDNWTAEVIIQV